MRGFLAPTLIDRAQAPFDALAYANGLAAHQHENGVGMRRGKDAQRNPTAFGNLHIESNGASHPIGCDLLPGDGLPVHNKLDGHLVGVTDAGPLNVPVGLLVVR